MKYCYLLIFFLLCTGVEVFAQDGTEKLVTVNFQGLRIEQFVKELENRTGYHFYYDPAKFDSLRVTMEVIDKPLPAVLNMAFQGTDYHYGITPDKQVYLTKGREVITRLAPGFADVDNQVTKNGKAIDQPVDYAEKAQKIPEATLENKLYEIGIKTNTIQAGKATLAGYVKDVKTGEPVLGASIYIDNLKVGTASDQFGYYSITLPKGKQILSIKGLGMRDTRRQVMLYSDGKLNIELHDQIQSLKEVVINSKNAGNVHSVELGVNKLDIKAIKQVPTVFGEADILRVVLTLPGVQSVGEASTGFNVRGGSADQNLILLDGATIYNPSHFFGFFSAFNPDIVKDVELYKSSIPERFGGRLSSVLDVTNREGNKKMFTGSAGIGLITSRFNIEGPIDKDKTSFIFGARTTYSNWLLNLLPAAYKNSSASFYDVNLDISHQINDKNNLYLTTYLSNDKFRLNSDTAYSYSNKNISLKWKHNFNNKLYSVLTGGYDRYEYSIASSANPLTAYQLAFNINQTNLKYDYTYYVSPKHTVDFGVSSMLYKLNPGTFTANSDKSLIIPETVAAEQALESAIYAGDKFDITPALSLSYGVRYSFYNYLGPQTVSQYAANLPKSDATRIDSVTYASGKVIKTYQGPEIRISGRYNFSDDFSVKAGYNTLRQYIHLLSNTTAIAPTDVWKLSDPNIPPQYGDQISLGLYKNFSKNTIETSVEVYYKRLRDYLDYKSGATLVLNQHIETDVLNTQGKAYGVEFFVKKATGKLNGWISYTYSRTLLKQDDPNAGELINGGNYYPADFDKPNAFNFIGNYRVSHRFSVSLNVTYSTGRPITLPIAKYYYAGSERVLYSDRNEYRIPDYFRTDFSMNIDGNHKIHQRTHNSWTIGVYNLTARQNAYSTYFTSENGVVDGYKLSIFATAIPFINYNISF